MVASSFGDSSAVITSWPDDASVVSAIALAVSAIRAESAPPKLAERTLQLALHDDHFFHIFFFFFFFSCALFVCAFTFTPSSLYFFLFVFCFTITNRSIWSEYRGSSYPFAG